MDPVNATVPITRPDPRKTIRMESNNDEDENTNQPPFRFMDLPPELRQAILEETDLVTPCREVQWRPRQGFSVTLPIAVMCKSRFEERLIFHETGSDETRRAWRSRCDFSCEEMRSAPARHQLGLPSCCSCRWESPRGLMSASRALYREAIDTVYRCNRIIVLPVQDDAGLFDAIRSASWLQGPRLDAARFLSANDAAGYRGALSQLRTLELVFPDLGLQGPPPICQQPERARVCRDWAATLRLLLEQQEQQKQQKQLEQQQQNTAEDGGFLSRLTLIVHMEVFSHGAPYIRVGQCGENNYRKLFEHMRDLLRASSYVSPSRRDKDLVMGHVDFLAPLRELRAGGLQKLYVFLEPNWHWSPRRGVRAYNDRDPDQAALDDVVVSMETYLEREVMGEDYDSATEGKMEEFPSQWMLARRAKYRDTVINPLRLF